MSIINSKNNIPIRLTDERWLHITEEHSEMAGHYFDVLETIAEPEVIYSGNSGELIAARIINAGKFLLVVYREVNQLDGFVITAFFTNRVQQLEKRQISWKQ